MRQLNEGTSTRYFLRSTPERLAVANSSQRISISSDSLAAGARESVRATSQRASSGLVGDDIALSQQPEPWMEEPQPVDKMQRR